MATSYIKLLAFRQAWTTEEAVELFERQEAPLLLSCLRCLVDPHAVAGVVLDDVVHLGFVEDSPQELEHMLLGLGA